jgi:hypothetical protein
MRKRILKVEKPLRDPVLGKDGSRPGREEHVGAFAPPTGQLRHSRPQ